MRQFNTPPGWPEPPTARWRPPKHWQPSEAWPPAPDGWAFWVDEQGKRVRGPLGRFGGPSRVKLGAIAAIPLALIALVLFNPFDGSNDSASTTPVRDTGTEPAPTAAGSTTVPTTGATPGRTEKLTRESTPTPTPSETPTSTPTPTQTQSAERTPPPTEPTATTEPTAPETSSAAVVYHNCAEVRAAGKAPLHRGDPGYSTALDRNGDGVACERGNS